MRKENKIFRSCCSKSYSLFSSYPPQVIPLLYAFSDFLCDSNSITKSIPFVQWELEES